MDLDFGLEFELGDAPQVLAQDFFFDFELLVVGGVLVMASATKAKVWARRRDSVVGRLNDCGGMRAGKAGFFLGEGGFDFLSG